MARGRPRKDAVDAPEPPSPAPADHNVGKPDEQALLLSHFDKLRRQEAVVAERKADYDAEKATMTDLFHVAKVDGFTRKELQALLDDSKAPRRNLVAEEERRAKLRAWLGLPIGTQGDLFANTPSEVKDEADFTGDGYAAGIRGDIGKPPAEVPARFVQPWMRGWGEGQDKLAWGLSEAGRVVDRNPPDPLIDE